MARRVNHGRAVLVLLAALAMVAVTFTVPPWAPRAAAATPGSITLQVKSARSLNPLAPTSAGFAPAGTRIPKYKWLINLDDVGNPGTAADPGTQNCLPATAGVGVGNTTNPDYADTCQWPSVRNTSGQAPIIAQGDQTTLDSSIKLAGLAPGKYLISVLADGYKIDGQHFTVADGQDGTPVIVEMSPTPLPLTTLRIQVFNDSVPVDSTYEVDAEKGLHGFPAHLSDVFCTVGPASSTNPLCPPYLHPFAHAVTRAHHPVTPAAHTPFPPPRHAAPPTTARRPGITRLACSVRRVA